ncbi:hypothetical protein I4I90_11275, partial [Corynebacterium diphtheriae bv. gravis]|nr:hypothetical protein [Corynebacterium diphtheriae bv. gravis]
GFLLTLVENEAGIVHDHLAGNLPAVPRSHRGNTCDRNSGVVTRLMRADTMWVEVAYVPTGDSQVARLWGLPDNAAQFAVEGQ